MKLFHIITLFPEAIEDYLHASILGRAEKRKILKFDLVDLRRFGSGPHKKVDDRPFGGGPGMVMQVEPIAAALQNIGSRIKNRGTAKRTKKRVILFSTRGKVFTQKEAKRLSKYDDIIFICGRYEGVDERVAEYLADEEVSIGNFILAGGELPALIVAEAVSRQVPGVLGKTESLEDIKGSYPVYTRPPVWKKHKVPDTLMSGNHKEIEKWRKL
ncbi:tRNA (guanosine(37)-N1)-methyltransferase TrmD [Patescibacteria group bacterium]|nr:tRNA (guanosine(37)-N1)-methyltransferase TrmD [Patescibacteria group bacterium]